MSVCQCDTMFFAYFRLSDAIFLIVNEIKVPEAVLP